MIGIRRSFSAKVILWVLLLAVPVFLPSIGVLFWQSHKLIRAEAVDRATGVLTCAMHRINRYLITAEIATDANAWLVEESLHPDSLLSFSNRILSTNPFTDGCAISTEPGVIPQYPEGTDWNAQYGEAIAIIPFVALIAYMVYASMKVKK